MNHKICLPAFLFLITLFSSYLLIGQSTIKGKVLDENNHEIPGAYIVIKGTTIGTTTDIDGTFTIKTDMELPFTLVVSYVGFTSKEIGVIDATEELVVKLKEGPIIEDVVVTALGTSGSVISMEAFKEAKFPDPPPQCYTDYEMPKNAFSGCKKLGDVAEKISNSLDAEDYPYRYLSFKNGFAVVTEMEQYNKDGSIIKDVEERRLDYPKQESFSWSINYFSSLIFPKKSYLRIFVFIVTCEIYSSGEERVSKKNAAKWYSRGVRKLPAEIAEIRFSKDHSVNLLLYEFEVPESNHKAEQHCPSRYPAKEHLKLSGLKSQFFSN